MLPRRAATSVTNIVQRVGTRAAPSFTGASTSATKQKAREGGFQFGDRGMQAVRGGRH